MHYRIEKSSPFPVQHTKGEIILKAEGSFSKAFSPVLKAIGLSNS